METHHPAQHTCRYIVPRPPLLCPSRPKINKYSINNELTLTGINNNQQQAKSTSSVNPFINQQQTFRFLYK